MASVNVQKFKKGEAKKLFRHDAQDTRLKDGHSNPHIDKKQTSQNLGTTTYEQACKAFDKRIAQLDAMPGANKRSDRVELLGVEIPVPNGISQDKKTLTNFAKLATTKMHKIFGTKNFVGGWLHIDEIHEYVDRDTKEKRTSLPHLHLYYVPEKSDKLCAKKVTTKSNLQKVQRVMDELCRKEFNAEFLTGEKAKNRNWKKVEDLKIDSDNLLAEIAKEKKELEARKKALDARERRLEGWERNLHRIGALANGMTLNPQKGPQSGLGR